MKDREQQDTDTDSKQQDSSKQQDIKKQDSKEQDMSLFLLSQCVSSIVGMVGDGEEVGVALPLESMLETLG